MYIKHYKVPYKNYYVAAFHSPVSNASEIRKWCNDIFGKPNFKQETQEVRWRDNIHYGEVLLSRESDLIMFLLRWE